MIRRLLPLLLLASLGLNLGLVLPRLLRGGEPPPTSPEAAASEEAANRRPPIFRRMADELRLEGELRERFLNRQQQFLDETLTARANLERIQGELRSELVARSPNRERADELLANLGDAHQQLETSFVHNLIDTREMLGPRQERRYLRMMHELRKSRAETRRLLMERWRRRTPEDRVEGSSMGEEDAGQRKDPAEAG